MSQKRLIAELAKLSEELRKHRHELTDFVFRQALRGEPPLKRGRCILCGDAIYHKDTSQMYQIDQRIQFRIHGECLRVRVQKLAHRDG